MDSYSPKKFFLFLIKNLFLFYLEFWEVTAQSVGIRIYWLYLLQRVITPPKWHKTASGGKAPVLQNWRVCIDQPIHPDRMWHRVNF